MQIAALTVGPEYNANFGNLYTFFMQQLVQVLPPGTDIPAAFAGGSDEEQAFVQNLALFLTSFFRVHPTPYNPQTLFNLSSAWCLYRRSALPQYMLPVCAFLAIASARSAA